MAPRGRPARRPRPGEYARWQRQRLSWLASEEPTDQSADLHTHGDTAWRLTGAVNAPRQRGLRPLPARLPPQPLPLVRPQVHRREPPRLDPGLTGIGLGVGRRRPHRHQAAAEEGRPRR